MHFSNIMKSCLLAPLTRMTRGIPLASTTMWRLEPSLPRSVGFGPVSWCPGGLVPRSHRCWPGSNQSGHVHADAPTWLGAVCARRRWHSSRADVASKSCHCRSPGTGEDLAMECHVCSTIRMPLRAASSLTPSLRAPPLADGVKVGIRGCSCRHSSLLAGCLAMRARSINASCRSQRKVVLAALSGVRYMRTLRSGASRVKVAACWSRL